MAAPQDRFKEWCLEFMAAAGDLHAGLEVDTRALDLAREAEDTWQAKLDRKKEEVDLAEERLKAAEDECQKRQAELKTTAEALKAANVAAAEAQARLDGTKRHVLRAIDEGCARIFQDGHEARALDAAAQRGVQQVPRPRPQPPARVRSKRLLSSQDDPPAKKPRRSLDSWVDELTGVLLEADKPVPGWVFIALYLRNGGWHYALEARFKQQVLEDTESCGCVDESGPFERESNGWRVRPEFIAAAGPSLAALAQDPRFLHA